MTSISAGTKVIWYLAEFEAAAAHFGEIQAWHFLIGCFKVCDLDIADLLRNSPTAVQANGPEIEGGWEGCLSVPGLRGWVERPAHIPYRGVGLDGETIERVARGFHARVVQHECDHLEGRLYTSRMSDLSRLIFESEIRHFHSNEGQAAS